MVEIKANDNLNRIVEGGLYLQQNDLVEVEGTNGKTYTIDIKRVPLHNRLFTVYGKSTNKTQPSVCLEGKKNAKSYLDYNEQTAWTSFEDSSRYALIYNDHIQPTLTSGNF